MTTCTEALREQLAQRIDALGCIVFATDDEPLKDREVLVKSVVLTVIRQAPLDPPACDAEKAVLVAALEPLARLAEDSPPGTPDGHCIYDGCFVGLDYGDARRARAALSDTPSAAAALLAQVKALEWYGDVGNWEYEHSPKCEEAAPGGPCIASLDCRPSCAAEKDEGRRARAALAPGESPSGD
jgi:hypothetical protein